GAYAEAGDHFRAWLTLQERGHGGEWRRYLGMSLLGESLLRQRRDAEAEPLLTQGHEGLRQRAPEGPPSIRAQAMHHSPLRPGRTSSGAGGTSPPKGPPSPSGTEGRGNPQRPRPSRPSDGENEPERPPPYSGAPPAPL